MDESPRSSKDSQEGVEPPKGQKRPLEDDAQDTAPKKARTTSSDPEEDAGGSGSGEAIKPKDSGRPAPKKQKEVKLECASCAAERIAQKACCPLCSYSRNVNYLNSRKQQFKPIRKSKKHHHAAEDDGPDSPHVPECANGGHVDLLPFVQKKIWWFAYPPENGES